MICPDKSAIPVSSKDMASSFIEHISVKIRKSTSHYLKHNVFKRMCGLSGRLALHNAFYLNALS